jgi:hypothetical protein
VELQQSDGGVTEATLLVSDLPVNIWVAFTDGSWVLRGLRAFDDRHEELAVVGSIPEDWQEPRSNAVWVHTMTDVEGRG